MSSTLEKVEETWCRKDNLAFQVGDTVDVKVKIKEGDKERVQVFNGVVIAKRGRGLDEMFTVRRIVQGEGVERTFPIHSPRIAGIDVKGRGKVRRAKLYYLRERTGKSTRLEQKIGATSAAASAKGGTEGAGKASKAAKKGEAVPAAEKTAG